MSAQPRRPEAVRGLLLVALSAVGFGTLGIFGKLGSRAGLTLPTLLALRFGLAAVVLGSILALRGELRRPSLRRAAPVALMGVLYVGQASCFFGSLRTVPAAVTSILLYTYPVIVTLLARLLFAEGLTRVRLAALFAASVGVVVVVDPFGARNLDPLGVALGLGSAVVYSAYILCGSLLLRDVAALPATTGIAATAALSFTGAGAVTGQLRGFDATGWLVVVGIAAVPTVIAATAFLAGLRRVGPSVASTVSTLEPASTAVLAALVLGETLSPAQLGGGLIVLVAAAILARATATAARVEATAEH
ncbi:MAG TPA: DMT family transporter [Candidatus Dormibacteraeota bacterium]|jgi:drug/metabolite transporter (DMT)-like permease|nr:DMT family transporter [Candidatus Dormibacteraeota bacterium]